MTESYHDYARITGEASDFFEWQTSIDNPYLVRQDVETETVVVEDYDFDGQNKAILLDAKDGEKKGEVDLPTDIAFMGAANGVFVVDTELGTSGNLIAYDIEQQQEIWRKSNSRGAGAISDGNVAVTNPGPVYAYDLQTGNQQWTSSASNSRYFFYLDEHEQIFGFWNGSDFNKTNNGIDPDTGNSLWSDNSYLTERTPGAGGDPSAVIRYSGSGTTYYISKIDSSGSIIENVSISLNDYLDTADFGIDVACTGSSGEYRQWSHDGTLERSVSGVGTNSMQVADYGDVQLATLSGGGNVTAFIV